MFDSVMSWTLIVTSVALMAWVGMQAVAGRNVAYHRIVALCLVIGLNLNTTEGVTGSSLSEFGLYMLLTGLFFGGVLAALDIYSRFSKRRNGTVSSKKSLGHELKQS